MGSSLIGDWDKRWRFGYGHDGFMVLGPYYGLQRYHSRFAVSSRRFGPVDEVLAPRTGDRGLAQRQSIKGLRFDN